jgi:hypothetical protein
MFENSVIFTRVYSGAKLDLTDAAGSGIIAVKTEARFQVTV